MALLLLVAEYLLVRGANLNLAGSWSGQTPLDVAKRAGRADIVAWLAGEGAIGGDRVAGVAK